jgi:hypothetical protein
MSAQIKATPEPLSIKLSPALFSLVKSANGQPGRKVEVMVLLNDSSQAALQELKRLGLEVTVGPNSSHLLTGRILVSDLPALAQLDNVRTIALK